MNFSSLYWLSGYGFLLYHTLQGAKRIITAEPFNPEVAIRIIEKYKVNHYVGSPTRLMEVAQSPLAESADLSSVRFIGSFGSILLPNILQALHRIFKNSMIATMYGSTETCGGGTFAIADKRLGYVGRIVPGVEAKIINEAGTALDNGERGEIVIRKAVHFVGYYKNPEATAEIMDADGWIRMGDLGYFTADGDLFIVDRIKSVINYRNYWVQHT